MDSKEKILVVDDEEIVRVQIGRLLSKEGYDVTLAKNGAEALGFLDKTAYDLVLSDIVMEDMDGLGLLEKVKAMYPDMIFLIITGHGSLSTAIESMRLGAFDYLLKPCENEELKLRVRRGLAQSRLQKKLEDQTRRLERMAITDGLTGVYTRSYFMENLDREFKHFSRYNIPLSFMMIDIDFFKEINDRYGHQAGDKVLKNLSETFLELVRDTDIIGRYGGDEFGIIQPSTDMGGGRKTALRILKSVENDITLCRPPGEEPQQVTVSIGLASCPHPKIRTTTQLIKAADIALYQAKRSGRDMMVVYEPEEDSIRSEEF